jgi:uncharacterized protein YcaQ
MTDPPRIPAKAAARLLLGAQGLLDDPSRRATRAAVRALVTQLGFVQMDTIAVVARAQDLVLRARLEGYSPAQLKALLEEDRFLFEHWTHDASVIPIAWYPHWKPRFRRDRARIRQSSWWRSLLGDRADEVIAHVLERITAEGPLRSADFEHPEKRGNWWGWKPHKAALDYLWRSGDIAIARRIHFAKVYDLTERVSPEAHALAEPDPAAHLAWACESAAERLVIFTPTELARFWGAVEIADARAFCARGVKRKRLVEVLVDPADGGEPQRAFALADWADRLRALPEAPPGIRLLAPFDPVIRDRARLLRRMGFDYRFEAYTPPAQRVHGYYVLPILEGERLVGRLDPKLHRDRGELEIRSLAWEPGVKPTRARRRALGDALEKLAAFVGAAEIVGAP